MISWLDQTAVELRKTFTSLGQHAFEATGETFQGSLLGRALAWAGSATPLYIDPETADRIHQLQTLILFIQESPEESPMLRGHLTPLNEQPFLKHAQGTSFEEAFPRRWETAEWLYSEKKLEKLTHFNSYRNTSYTLETLPPKKEVKEHPESYLLSEEEQGFLEYYRLLIKVEQAVERYFGEKQPTKEELLQTLSSERDNLLTRHGIIPTAGFFLGAGLSAVNPLLGLAVSSGVVGLQMRHKVEPLQDAMGAASTLSSGIGLTGALAGAALSPPVAAAAGAVFISDLAHRSLKKQ